MYRLIDLFAILALAVVLLLPKARVDARRALEGAPVELDAIASLQDELFRHPEDKIAAIDLADTFLSYSRADWAITTLEPFVARERAGKASVDAKLHLVLATARSERLELSQSVAESKIVEQACAEAPNSPRCPGGTEARVQLISGAMKTLLEQHIDPIKDPARAKKEVLRVLHPSRPGFLLNK